MIDMTHILLEKCIFKGGYIPKIQKTNSFEYIRCPYCSTTLVGNHCPNCDKVITDKDRTKQRVV